MNFELWTVHVCLLPSTEWVPYSDVWAYKLPSMTHPVTLVCINRTAHQQHWGGGCLCTTTVRNYPAPAVHSPSGKEINCDHFLSWNNPSQSWIPGFPLWRQTQIELTKTFIPLLRSQRRQHLALNAESVAAENVLLHDLNVERWGGGR